MKHFPDSKNTDLATALLHGAGDFRFHIQMLTWFGVGLLVQGYWFTTFSLWKLPFMLALLSRMEKIATILVQVPPVFQELCSSSTPDMETMDKRNPTFMVPFPPWPLPSLFFLLVLPSKHVSFLTELHKQANLFKVKQEGNLNVEETQPEHEAFFYSLAPGAIVSWRTITVNKRKPWQVKKCAIHIVFTKI